MFDLNNENIIYLQKILNFKDNYVTCLDPREGVQCSRAATHIWVLCFAASILSCGLEFLFLLWGVGEFLKFRVQARAVSACGAAVADVQRAASALQALCGILSEVTLKSWPCCLAVTTPSMAAVTTSCYAVVTSGCCDDHSDLRRDAVIAAFRVELTR